MATKTRRWHSAEAESWLRLSAGQHWVRRRAALRSSWALLKRPALGFDLMRVYLGIGLVVRGILFIRDPEMLTSLFSHDHWAVPFLEAHVVTVAHLVGGAFLALGLFTRWAAAVQVPPLVGAVVLVHLNEQLFTRGQSFEFSLLVTIMLVLYAAFGAGPLSLDHYLRRARSARREQDESSPTAGPTASK